MKIKYFLAAAFIVSAAFVANAQQDTTNTQRQRSRSQQATQGQPEQQGQPSNQFNSKDYTQVQSGDVPANLRSTLQEDQYKGWESGKLYKRNSGDGYYLSTGNGNTAKEYYFDKNGKAMQSQGSTKPKDH